MSNPPSERPLKTYKIRLCLSDQQVAPDSQKDAPTGLLNGGGDVTHDGAHIRFCQRWRKRGRQLNICVNRSKKTLFHALYESARLVLRYVAGTQDRS